MKIANKIIESLNYKIVLKQSLDKMEIEALLQKLADNDINAKEEDGVILVEPSDSRDAKKLIDKFI